MVKGLDQNCQVQTKNNPSLNHSHDLSCLLLKGPDIFSVTITTWILLYSSQIYYKTKFKKIKKKTSLSLKPNKKVLTSLSPKVEAVDSHFIPLVVWHSFKTYW